MTGGHRRGVKLKLNAAACIQAEKRRDIKHNFCPLQHVIFVHVHTVCFALVLNGTREPCVCACV